MFNHFTPVFVILFSLLLQENALTKDRASFPAAPDARWTYITKSWSSQANDWVPREWPYFVSHFNKEDDSLSFTIQQKDGNELSFVVDDRGVRSIKKWNGVGFLYHFREPATLLEFPLEKGKTWLVGAYKDKMITGEDIWEEMVAELENYEVVKVPAGTFHDCLKVKYRSTVGMVGRKPFPPSNFYIWYAPGIGIVKIGPASENLGDYELGATNLKHTQPKIEK